MSAFGPDPLKNPAARILTGRQATIVRYPHVSSFKCVKTTLLATLLRPVKGFQQNKPIADIDQRPK